MSFAKSVSAAVAVAVAVALSACGTAAKPVAGTRRAAVITEKGRNDPRKTHIACLKSKHVDDVRRLTISGYPAFQVGTRPAGPTVVFYPTPGAAQYQQISGRSEGAEIVGAALVYPNQAPSKLLNVVEPCVAKGVSG